MIHLSSFTWLQLYTWKLQYDITSLFQLVICHVIAKLHCILQFSKKLNNNRNYQEQVHKTLWKKYASLQSEAELCAIFKKKDYQNKSGSQSFKHFFIILLAFVSKTNIHLSVEAKLRHKSDLKFLEFPQTLLFISQSSDSFVILFATWDRTPHMG